MVNFEAQRTIINNTWETDKHHHKIIDRCVRAKRREVNKIGGKNPVEGIDDW